MAENKESKWVVEIDLEVKDAARLIVEASEKFESLSPLDAFKLYLKEGWILAVEMTGVDQSLIDVIQVSVPDWMEELAQTPLEDIRRIAQKLNDLPPILVNYDHEATYQEEIRYQKKMDLLRWGDQE